MFLYTLKGSKSSCLWTRIAALWPNAKVLAIFCYFLLAGYIHNDAICINIYVSVCVCTILHASLFISLEQILFRCVYLPAILNLLYSQTWLYRFVCVYACTKFRHLCIKISSKTITGLWRLTKPVNCERTHVQTSVPEITKMSAF